jgi:hypothetical protein
LLYFTTQGATTPAMPSNPSPGSQTSPGPALGSNNVTFSWTASSGALAYSLAARNLTTNALEVNVVISSTSYSKALTAGTSYRWDVAACGTTDCSSAVSPYTPLLYFTTPGATTPSMPLNPSPGSQTSPGPALGSNNVTFSWSASSGALAYSLAARNLTTNVLQVNVVISSTSFSTTLTAGTPYRWDVAACGTTDCSSVVSPYTPLEYFRTP